MSCGAGTPCRSPAKPGSETWKCDEAGNADCWKTGGGGMWVTGSYDPETNTTYWGTGNPVPMFDPEYRPGRQPLHQLERGA